ELGGPDISTFRELMEEMLEVIDRRRLLVPVPWFIADIQASVLGLLPNPLLTRDQVKLLRHDNVVSQAAIAEGRTLPGLGIEPRSTDAILPGYLWRFRPAGQFTRKTEA
ncbi:MAG: complex I NDUFA9 subunit family protein, partial [Mesorhizobium sp.]|nr:complex I NDUFA9 subunit family protein [Mesorhizobium sp.]